jgi:hypothetical protein
MEFLTQLTSVVDYIALTFTVWLGWYILTRSIKQPISWLTSLTLWSISGIFINSLLAIHPPPIPENVPDWLAFIFPFWSKDVLVSGSTGWLSGWLVIPSVGFWHHVTMLTRPERWKAWHYIQVAAVYLVTLAAILATRNTSYMYIEVTEDVLILKSLKPGVLYTTFFILLGIILILCFFNLRYAARKAQSTLGKKQLQMLTWATLVAGLTAPISLIAVSIKFSLPIVINSVILATSALIIGISVGKYSALIEGRILRRDFLYSAAAMAIVALLYSVVIWISVLIFDVPPAAYIFIIIFAFATHSIVDTARRYLDLFFYRKEDRILRQKIRQLSSRVGNQGLKETLELALDLAATSVRATFGLIILFEQEKNQLTATYQWNKDSGQISRNVLMADDYQQFDPGHLPAPITDTVLLIPLYLHEEQIGTILFGPPINSIRYPETEVDRLLDVSEQISTTIQQVRQENQLLEQAAQTIQIPQIGSPKPNEKLSVQNLEDALRNIYDFAYLGDCDLAEIKLVKSRLPDQGSTHIDRGKVVFKLIEDAVIRLKPEKEFANDIPSREWYPYLILHYAYFEDKLNREIMSMLYISEGTFNRTRRSAIRSVARVLSELEKSSS